jgi:hypothetical protein
MSILNISINIVSSSIVKRKGKDIELAKEVFRRWTKAKEKMPYIKG